MPYRSFFGLQRAPFSSEIEPHQLFAFEAFQQCLARLEYGVRERGMFAIIGEPGAGKTSVVRAATARLAPSSYVPLYEPVPNVNNPLVPVAEKLLADLGGKIPHHNPGGMLRRLNEALASQHEKGRTVVLTLDEAHLFDDKGLLHTKTLLNHDRDSRLAVVIVLVGGMELGRRLAQSNLEEVRQRLLFIYPLKGLKRAEMAPYLTARLRAAGCERDLFPPELADEMYKHTHGLPRLVNQLANLCLVAAANARKSPIDSDCLLQALNEAGHGPEHATERVGFAPAGR
jgi:type II secretory pathway predicted ATPase ExeA